MLTGMRYCSKLNVKREGEKDGDRKRRIGRSG